MLGSIQYTWRKSFPLHAAHERFVLSAKRQAMELLTIRQSMHDGHTQYSSATSPFVAEVKSVTAQNEDDTRQA